MSSAAILEQLARAFGENGDTPAPPVGERIPKGGRNATLTSLAGTMRRRGMTEGEIAAALVAVNTRCSPPLDEAEVGRIAASVARYSPTRVVSDHMEVEERSETKLPFYTAAEIAAQTPAQVEWVGPPWVARGAITELVGKVKAAGKTTWVTHLIGSVLEGTDFMGEPTSKSPVVLLTEQGSTTLREALRRADLLDRADLHVLYWHDTIGIPWARVCRAAADKCLEVGAKLLVVDTVSQFAGLRGDEENSAGDALGAVQPLQEIAAKGIAVVGVRHERKGGGEVGESGRGSSAFAGAADIVLALRRGDGNSRPTIRVIHALSRFDETPDTLVIELTEQGYVALGTETAIAVSETKTAILDGLAAGEELTEKEIVETALPGSTKRTTFRRALEELRTEGRITRSGKGKRGDPYRYSEAIEVCDQTSTTNGQKESKGV